MKRSRYVWSFFHILCHKPDQNITSQLCDPANFEPGDSILKTDPGRMRRGLLLPPLEERASIDGSPAFERRDVVSRFGSVGKRHPSGLKKHGQLHVAKQV